MVMAAATAIIARVNLPISVALVWITNPPTMPPIFYFTFCRRRGIDTPARPPNRLSSVSSIFPSMAAIWQPLFLGSLICALLGRNRLLRNAWSLAPVACAAKAAPQWHARFLQPRKAVRRPRKYTILQVQNPVHFSANSKSWDHQKAGPHPVQLQHR